MSESHIEMSELQEESESQSSNVLRRPRESMEPKDVFPFKDNNIRNFDDDESDDDEDKEKGMLMEGEYGKDAYTKESIGFIIVIVCFEFFFVLFCFFLVGNGQEEFIEEMKDAGIKDLDGNFVKDDPAVNNHFHLYIESAFMIFLGIGLLYSYLKHFGYFALSMCLIIGAFTAQYAIICNGYADIIVGVIKDENPKYYVILGIPMMLQTVFSGAVTLISAGVLIGKLTPLQLLIFVILELPVYALNNAIIYGFLEISDVGGTISVHIFSAYFGLFCSWICSKRIFKENEPQKAVDSKISNLFSMIGTISLWILWPSFNASFEPVYRHRVIVNTYMGLLASCLTAAVSSRLLRKRFLIADLQNATLAGGVILGAICNHKFPVGVPVVLGIVGGFVSVFGYRWVGRQLLYEKLYLDDPAGVHNLHALPGLIGAFASMITVIGVKDDEDMVKWGEYQPLIQLAGICVTLITSLFGGLIAGFVIRCLRWFYPPEPFQISLYEDKTYFFVDEDYDDLTNYPKKDENNNNNNDNYKTVDEKKVGPEEKKMDRKLEDLVDQKRVCYLKLVLTESEIEQIQTQGAVEMEGPLTVLNHRRM